MKNIKTTVALTAIALMLAGNAQSATFKRSLVSSNTSLSNTLLSNINTRNAVALDQSGSGITANIIDSAFLATEDSGIRFDANNQIEIIPVAVFDTGIHGLETIGKRLVCTVLVREAGNDPDGKKPQEVATQYCSAAKSCGQAKGTELDEVVTQNSITGKTNTYTCTDGKAELKK